MKTEEIYREVMPFLVARSITILMGALSITFLALLLIQILGKPIGDNPAPN